MAQTMLDASFGPVRVAAILHVAYFVDNSMYINKSLVSM